MATPTTTRPLRIDADPVIVRNVHVSGSWTYVPYESNGVGAEQNFASTDPTELRRRADVHMEQARRELRKASLAYAAADALEAP